MLLAFTTSATLAPVHSRTIASRLLRPSALAVLALALVPYSAAAQKPAKPPAIDALAEKGDFDGRLRECREAVHLHPKNADAHAALGWVLEKKGDLNAALPEYREAVRLDPGDLENHWRLAQALGQTGDAAGAMREY